MKKNIQLDKVTLGITIALKFVLNFQQFQIRSFIEVKLNTI